MRRVGMFLLAGLWLASSVGSSAAPDEIAVIVNKSNKMAGLSSGALKNIILGARRTWPNGQKITIVMAPPGHLERKSILRVVCDMNDSQYNLHLMRSAAKGDVIEAPAVGSSSTDVLSRVAKNPNAVGFVRASEINDSVSVVMIDGLTPGQPGYVISLQGAQ